jgi:DNA topoisomerase-1
MTVPAHEIGPAGNERIARKRIVQAIDVVATRLGNTRAVCRKCYVHPLILDAYAEGRLGARDAPPGAPPESRYAASAGKSSDGGRAARASRS